MMPSPTPDPEGEQLMANMTGREQNPKRVLFVCVENANRSQMAEVFARVHGGGKVESYSAGSRPSGKVNPRAVQFMREVGHDLSGHDSKSLDQFKDAEIDVAVTMGCGDACPLVRARRREEWNIPDPKELPDDEFRKIRDLIEQKVKDLLARLAAEGESP
jgi:arsenate reductase